jgi:hypothetical protein
MTKDNLYVRPKKHKFRNSHLGHTRQNSSFETLFTGRQENLFTRSHFPPKGKGDEARLQPPLLWHLAPVMADSFYFIKENEQEAM